MNDRSSAARAIAGIGLRNIAQILKQAPKTRELDIVGYVIPKIEFLKSLGFKRPLRTIDLRPAILFMDRETLQAKIDEMKALGFKDPICTIELLPTLCGCDVQGNIASKVLFLKTVGFKNPIKMIEAMPALITVDLQSRVEPHLAQLREIGFRNVILMIERAPSILFFDCLEKIVPKVEFLRELGFVNPLAMIERRPGILVLDDRRNILPSVRELAEWGYSRHRLEMKPRLLCSSLARIHELRSYLANLSFDVSRLPAKTKERALESLKFEDIHRNLEARGHRTQQERANALDQPENWNWIFIKAIRTALNSAA